MRCLGPETLERLASAPWQAFGESCALPYVHTPVPFVVALVCLIILGLFGVAFSWLLISSSRFTWAFSSLTRKIRMIRSREEPLDEAGLRRIGDLLGRNRSTAHGWKEFKETLVHEKGGVLNTRPAQDFFPEHEIVEARIHLGFFDAVPALLTGLGLFATFVALFLGLGGLKVPAGGKIEGIDSFIEALSGKFLSSVLGLFTAVVFTFAKAFRVPKAHLVYRRFCEAFDALFDRITPEDLLHRLNGLAAEQSATLKSLATDISDRFHERMTENLRPPLERMVDLLQRSLEERAQTFEDMASRLADTFRSNFTQSTNFEFDQVSRALDQTVSMVGRMEERAAASERGFEELIGRMSESSRQLVERLDSATASLGTTQSQARQALEETVRQILEANAKQVAASAQQVQTALSMLETQMRQILASLGEAAGGLRQGGLDAQAKLLEAADALATRVANSATEATSALAGTAESVLTHHSEQTGQLQQRLETLLNREEGRAELLAQQREAQREALREFGQVLSESKATIEGLQVASAGTREAASMLERTVEEMRAAQAGARGLVDASGEQARAMRAVLESHQSLLAEYERVFQAVDEGLSRTISNLAGELVRFQEQATEQLRRQLGVFDEHLGTATDKLGSAVEDLGTRLEDASETIANAVARAAPIRG